MSAFDPKTFLSSLTQRAGVYVMSGDDGAVLYIGKAKNLKSRLSSYFVTSGLSIKTRALVKRIADIKVTVVGTEIEALLLEQNLIKEHRPPYNVLLRDDKSFPFIHISTDAEFPRVSVKRGKRASRGRSFGPYTSGLAVKESLNYLQKTFKVRVCEDNTFRNRSRPCLEYQINRCKAPCVDYIDKDEYRQDVNQLIDVLEGRGDVVIERLTNEMSEKSEQLDFEAAAELRDQVQALRHVQSKQHVDTGESSAEVFHIENSHGVTVIQQLGIRAGRMTSTYAWYPKVKLDESMEEVLSQFIAQLYLDHRPDLAAEIITNIEPTDSESLQDALKAFHGKSFVIRSRVRGVRAKWLTLASDSAVANLTQRLQSQKIYQTKFTKLSQQLDLPELKHIECFDISHSSGERPVGSCVVYDAKGAKRKAFRAYHLDGVNPGDDYEAMKLVLTRRIDSYAKGNADVPELWLIDGGKGQSNIALKVLAEAKLSAIQVVGVAKGPERKAGLETLYVGSAQNEVHLLRHDPAFHLIQQVRDEAHNFAVKSHRKRRDKKRSSSSLEDLPGIGKAKAKSLITYFGGLQGIEAASIEELEKVRGVSKKLAKTLFDYFHPESS